MVTVGVLSSCFDVSPLPSFSVNLTIFSCSVVSVSSALAFALPAVSVSVVMIFLLNAAASSVCSKGCFVFSSRNVVFKLVLSKL